MTEIEIEAKEEQRITVAEKCVCSVCVAPATRWVAFGRVEHSYGLGDRVDLCDKQECYEQAKETALEEFYETVTNRHGLAAQNRYERQEDK